MSSGTQSRVSRRSALSLLPVLAILASPFAVAGFSAAQVHGVPPSVTSIQYHVPPFLPNALPSVTSLGPHGNGYRAGPIPAPYGIYPVSRGYGHRNSYGYGGYSAAYVAPYYFPMYDTSAGYDSGGAGPYMYSGPAAEQTLHVVVDLPTTKRSVAEDNGDLAPANRDSAAISVPDAKPVDATVLVFRDGHQQEVNNYAIMGQTVYVFDNRTQKIALTDLDVAATVKLNDDRGVDFHVPAHTKS
jgi:hypothetical protein